MKRCLASLLCICMAVFLSSCSGRKKEQVYDGQSQSMESGQGVQQPDVTSPKSEPLNEESKNENALQTDGSDSSVLIAYFTWADNTQVENPDVVDVDATTSAGKPC